jgi:hypothetical protein
MGESRDKVLVDLADAVVSASVRTVERLEDDGIDMGEAIRLVVRVLANVTETELAQRSDPGRGRSAWSESPDDRELGGES